MGNQLTDIDLCEALSDIFVDNVVDYLYIASIAKNFSIEHVEYVFFEWVAPICYINFITPIPSVWNGFEREKLWEDIEKYRTSNNKNFIKIMKKKFLNFILRKKLKLEWMTLKRYIEAI